MDSHGHPRQVTWDEGAWPAGVVKPPAATNDGALPQQDQRNGSSRVEENDQQMHRHRLQLRQQGRRHDSSPRGTGVVYTAR